jgi:predicted naringenin-chalcone synthase
VIERSGFCDFANTQAIREHREHSPNLERNGKQLTSAFINRIATAVDALRVYSRGRFPTTAQRMQLFEKHAPGLAVETVRKLDLGLEARRLSHVIVTSCTGMYAPGRLRGERGERRPDGARPLAASS